MAGLLDRVGGAVDRLRAAIPSPRPTPVPDAEEPDLPEPPDTSSDPIPRGLQVAAQWAWRLLAIAALAYLVGKIVGYLSEVTIPLAVSLLLTAAFWPLKEWLTAHKVRPGLAALICLVALAVLVLGILSLVSVQIAAQWDELVREAIASFNGAVEWFNRGPLHITTTQVNAWLSELNSWASHSQGQIAGYATEVGSQVGRFFAGLALVLFALFYFLYQGRTLARGAAVLVPRRSRARLLDAASRGWTSLVSYVRAAVIVAGVDGLGALIGAAALGSSMWLAIGALTFLCAFIPLVGAVLSGVVAVGVVFVTLGPLKAIIMLIVFVAVLEIEAHVLQPFLLGKAVSIHPLVVLYGIAVGVIVGGLVGALFMVPLLAFANAFVHALAHEPGEPLPPREDRLLEDQLDREKVPPEHRQDARDEPGSDAADPTLEATIPSEPPENPEDSPRVEG